MTEPQEPQESPVPQEVQEFAGKLFTFARTGDVTLLDYIDNGVDIDLTNQDGNTFLMLAAYCGQSRLTQGLLERGADVNRLNNRGQSPLAGVIFKKEDAIVDLLLGAGADPRLGHPNALESATMFGRADLLEKLKG